MAISGWRAAWGSAYCASHRFGRFLAPARRRRHRIQAAIPLGGYVKLLDEREGPPPPTSSRAYNRKPAGNASGCRAMPFAVAACALFVVRSRKPVIGEVAAGSVAERAGSRPTRSSQSAHARPRRASRPCFHPRSAMEGDAVELRRQPTVARKATPPRWRTRA
jgi:hypothetical protein